MKILPSCSSTTLGLLSAMYLFGSARTACRYSIAISALLQLIRFIDCTSNSVFPVGSKIVGVYQKHPIVCDRRYRSRYFSSELQNGRYTDFGPVAGFPEAIERKPTKEQMAHPRDILKFDYDSEFMSAGDTTAEFLLHNNDESAEFMNYRDETSAFRRIFYRNMNEEFVCNSSDTRQVYDVKNERDPQKEFFWSAGRKKPGEINLYEPPQSMPRKRFFLRLREAERKFEDFENGNYARAYTMADTFSSMFDGRRDSLKNFRTNLRRAGWSEDSCKSLRRIVGGYVVESAEELPYMVFVDTGCGGGIIGDNWVLTAGHCVDDDEPRYVHTGSIRLMAGCQYTIVHVYVHPRFTRECLQHDIALLKISPSFVFSPAIKPIRMSETRVRRRTCGIVAGWGAETYRGPPRYKLMMTMIPIVSRKKCRMFGLRPGQFCAGYQDASSDACQGDSGGPLVINGIIAGIVSFGYKCATPRVPGVYVDVSYHRKWIRSITGI